MDKTWDIKNLGIGKDLIMKNKPIKKLLNAPNLHFKNAANEDVGKLLFDGNKMCFRGNVDESAKEFFDYLVNTLINPYMKSKMEK